MKIHIANYSLSQFRLFAFGRQFHHISPGAMKIGNSVCSRRILDGMWVFLCIYEAFWIFVQNVDSANVLSFSHRTSHTHTWCDVHSFNNQMLVRVSRWFHLFCVCAILQSLFVLVRLLLLLLLRSEFASAFFATFSPRLILNFRHSYAFIHIRRAIYVSNTIYL